MPEISFSRNAQGVVEPHLGLVPAGGLADQDLASPAFLEAVNGLLAAQRLKAWDHDAKDHNGQNEMFFGAALVRTADNRFYLAANIHQKNALTTRDCAEANAINQAAQDTPMHQLAITDVWFMGGKGNLSQGVTILPEEKGRRNCPCGSCLDVISNTRMGVDTRVHMLPLNDGDWALRLGGENAKQPEAQQVVTRSIGELFPRERLNLADMDGRLKERVLAGWEYLHQPSEVAEPIMAGRVPSLEQVSVNEQLRGVNRLMHEAVRQEMAKAGHKPLHKAALAVVKTNSGRMYLGCAFVDGRTMGMPSAVLNAIQNAGRDSVSDVYLLNVDFRHERAQREAYAHDSAGEVEIAMPDGETRDRIWKARAKSDSANTSAPSPKVHLLTLNAVHDFDPALQMRSFDIQALLPYAFTSPKHDPQRDVYAVHHAGVATVGDGKGVAAAHGA